MSRWPSRPVPMSAAASEARAVSSPSISPSCRCCCGRLGKATDGEAAGRRAPCAGIARRQLARVHRGDLNGARLYDLVGGRVGARRSRSVQPCLSSLPDVSYGLFLSKLCGRGGGRYSHYGVVPIFDVSQFVRYFSSIHPRSTCAQFRPLQSKPSSMTRTVPGCSLPRTGQGARAQGGIRRPQRCRAAALRGLPAERDNGAVHGQAFPSV